MAVLAPPTRSLWCERRWGWSALALLVWACSVPEGKSLFPALDAHVASADHGLAGRDGGPVAEGPHGQWLLYLEQHHCLTAFNNVNENVVATWYLSEIGPLGEGDGARERYLRQSIRMCAQQISPVIGGLVTHVPPALTRSLPELSFDAFLIDAGDAHRYLSAEAVETWGVADVAVGEPLPSESDDPRVWDQDADGAPGVTLVIGNDFCDVYVVQRTRMRYSGAIIDAHLIEGEAWLGVEQAVLDAELPLCAASNELSESSVPHRFVLLRIDGVGDALRLDIDGDGKITCDDVSASTEFLFESGILEYQGPDPARCR